MCVHVCVVLRSKEVVRIPDSLQGLARSKRIKKTKPDDLQECLQLAVCRLMFPGVRECCHVGLQSDCAIKHSSVSMATD